MENGIDKGLLLLLLIVGVAVLFFEISLLGSVYGAEERHKRQLKKRLNDLRDKVKRKVDGDLLKDGDSSDRGARYFSRIPLLRGIKPLIERSGSNIKSGQFALLMLLCAIVGGFLCWYYVRLPGIVLIVSILSCLIPLGVLLHLAKKRLALFDEQLSDALDVIIRALRAGHPFDSSLKVVGEELPAPISDEFTVVAAEINYGVPVASALHDLTIRMPSKQLKSFVTAVMVQRETGGNLAEILENISSVIRGGFKFQRKLNTLSAEGRMSIVILAGTPVFLGSVLNFMYPANMEILYTSTSGQNLLYVSAFLYIFGFIWAKSIVRIEV
jgi:tight adherence protein B